MEKTDIFALMHRVLGRAMDILKEEGDVPPAVFLSTAMKTYVIPIGCSCSGPADVFGEEASQIIRAAARDLNPQALVLIRSGQDDSTKAMECISVEALCPEGAWQIRWMFSRDNNGHAVPWDENPCIPDSTLDAGIWAFDDLFRDARKFQ